MASKGPSYVHVVPPDGRLRLEHLRRLASVFDEISQEAGTTDFLAVEFVGWLESEAAAHRSAAAAASEAGAEAATRRRRESSL